jgi:hypothetical protein
MQFESVKHIAQYYKAIPGMLRLLQQEREELEGNYYGLRGLAYDGTPHSSSPGKPTEEAGLRALESGVGDRLAEIKANEMVLSADAAAIRGCLDAVNGRYKQVILMRYVRGYSWAKTGVRMNAPDSTVRNWHERAMERFGEALEELPEAAELAARAARAYIISAEKFCAGSGMVLGLCLPPTGTDFRRGEPPETSPKGSFLNRLYARRVQVSTKRGKAVEKQFANGGKARGFCENDNRKRG